MTARFLAMYETPADPEAFDRHYRETHIALIRRLPGLRRYTLGRAITALHGAPYYPGRRAGMGHHGRAAGRIRHAPAADAARLQELAPVRRMIFTAEDTAG